MPLITIRTLRKHTILFGIILVLVLISAGLFLFWERPVWRVSAEAKHAFAEGRYSDASVLVDRWLVLRPASAQAHFLRAKAALALGKPDQLADGLRQAANFGYPSDQLAIIHALISAQRGKVAIALPILTQAFGRLEGPDPIIEEALARVLLDTYDFDRAIPVLDRWANDAPTDPRPPLWRGVIRRRQGNEPKINIVDFREALRRSPDYPEAMLALAEELTKIHETAEASPLFDRYISLKPDDPAGHLGAGRNAYERAELDTAAAHLDRSLALNDNNAEAHIERSKITQLKGDQAGTLHHIDRAITLKPYDATLRYNRVIALNRLGRRDEAAKEQIELNRVKAEIAQADAIQNSLLKSPKDANLQSQLASWMYNHGYIEEGLRWARKVLVDHPGHPATCSLLADHYDRMGDPAQANLFRAQAR